MILRIHKIAMKEKSTCQLEHSDVAAMRLVHIRDSRFARVLIIRSG
jgi:hypothetical protein